MRSTRMRMGKHFTSNQVLGRTRTIGCVAVEVTQRCNLDCSLCYLSESSEDVIDLPIEEIKRRLDLVLEHFGEGTHVQITGGDPALRKHTELVEIVRYASDLGLHPALFTNGIAATRKLLEQLSVVGLQDVAFHVDMTQKRKGYTNEMELNVLRQEYLERAQGLGLMVIFNTTVFSENIHEIPDLVRFFIRQADRLGFCSFQLQADTGRGILKKRDAVVSQDSVRECIEVAARKALPWDVVQIGHRACHSYMPLWVANQALYPVIEDEKLVAAFLEDFKHVRADRHSTAAVIFRDYLFALACRPLWWWHAACYLCQQLKYMRRDVLAGGARIHKLSFFIQNFMDRDGLEKERLDACSFMVMSGDGPVSMCEHNARRDDFILKPVRIDREDGSSYVFQPLKGQAKRTTAW